MPIFGVDASDLNVDEVGGFLKLGITFKDDDNAADVSIKTASGQKTISDYALKMNWSKRLRSLMFKSPANRLFAMGVISEFNTYLDSELHFSGKINFFYRGLHSNKRNCRHYGQCEVHV